MTSIGSIACVLPEAEITNADLDRENPDWRMGLVAELSGVESRRVAASDETEFDLSVQACEALLSQPGLAAKRIDAILCCTQDPDYPLPGNAHLLHAHLGLDDHVVAFDYTLACSGFVYGLALADSLARTGSASGLLLVTSVASSKRVNARDRSVRVLFGDGAAATYLSAEDGEGARVVAYELCSHGAGFKHAYIPAGGARNPAGEETKREMVDESGNIRTLEDLHMEGTDLWGFVNSTVPGHVESFLAKHSLTLEQIDLCVFHQASGMILNSLARALSIPSEKMYVHMKEIGNLSAASIPFALRAALDEGAIRPGDRVLLSGFGIGISYGSAILEF